MKTKTFIKKTEGIPICLTVANLNTFQEYPFHEVTRKEIMKHRLSGKPGLVYKAGNRLFYASISGDIKLNSQDANIGIHMCGRNCSKVCAGCPRTSDLTVPYQMREKKCFFDSVVSSWRIEKYNFIVEGFEAFNMDFSNDVMIVISCQSYNYKNSKLTHSVL